MNECRCLCVCKKREKKKESSPNEIIWMVSHHHLVLLKKREPCIKHATWGCGEGHWTREKFMKMWSGLWSVLLNCGLCELKLGWIMPASERNRQGLCLTWSLAYFCSIHVCGAMLTLNRQACMLRPGQSLGEWQGPWLALGVSAGTKAYFRY